MRAQGQGYVLEADQLQVDVARFEQLTARGRDLAVTGAADAAARAFRDALALWRGPALADLADQDFARIEAARLEIWEHITFWDDVYYAILGTENELAS